MPSHDLRILALVTDAFGAGGGIAQYNRDLMTALDQCDDVAEITVLPRLGPPRPATPPKVRQLAPAAGRAAWSARAIALAARQHYDAIFCGHLNAAPLAAAIARFRRKPLWVQVHGIEAWQERGAAHRQALAGATLVTSVSRYTRQKLLAWSDVAPERVRVLPNTVGSRYVPREARPDLAARYDLAGKRVILTVGRLSTTERYKGHDRIVAAMPDVIARVPNVVYLVVGSGDDRSRLEQLAQETGVADRVIFAGQVPDEALEDYFAMADVFSMPSTGEGFGIVFLEAAVSGLPVIAGNRDGSVDALADGVIGRLVDPQSHEQIVAAVVDALHRRAGPDPVEVRRFSFGNFSSHVDDLVRTLVH